MCPEISIENSLKQEIEKKARQKGFPEIIPLLIELIFSSETDLGTLHLLIKNHLPGEKQDG